MAQQAVKLRPNDLYNTVGGTGIRTCWHKIEFDGPFDQVQWFVGSKIASGTPGTYKVQFAVTDTVAVDTVNNEWVPMRAGVAYNDTSANGWQNATFGGAATKQIGLAPNQNNNSAIHMSTDVLSLSSIARADGKAGGILLVKVTQVDTAASYTAANSASNAWDTARGTQAWFREWFCTATTTDGIANLNALPTGTGYNGDYVFPGVPVVTTTTPAVPIDLILFTGDSRKSAAYSTLLFNCPNRMAAMSLSSSAHPVSTVNASGSGHSQAQYLALAMDMINAGLRPTIIFIPGFSQNGFTTYSAFKTANDNFMSSVRAVSGLANVKFVLDTDYYVAGYAASKEADRQSCISYAKSLANGTSVWCVDSDVIMTDYTNSAAPVLRPAYMSGGDGAVHAGPPGLNAMAYGDKSGPGMLTTYRNAMAITDTTAPTLSVPTATATGSATGTGTVKTNESGGLLYYLANTSPSATAAQVMSGASQAPVVAGTQTVAFSGLPAATTLYPHYVQTDSAGLVSNVADGSSFTTPAAAMVSPSPAAVAYSSPAPVMGQGQTVTPSPGVISLAGVAPIVITPVVTGVVVTPSTATVPGGGTVDFDWIIQGTNNPSQAATVSTTLGTIDSNGVLTAPPSTTEKQTGVVTVTSVANPTKSGTANFTVPLVLGPTPAPILAVYAPMLGTFNVSGALS